MKKIISVILVFVLSLSLAATNVFAAPAWKKGDGKLPPGIFKKLFDDADEVKWAQKSIEKLKLKGFIRGWNGKFFPNSSVTQIEAVVMALRIMDWEDEALSVQELPKKYKGEAVQKWAYGYVAIAEEKGILDDVDMMYFKPSAPAKRHEVAKYVIRALIEADKLDKDPEDYMDEELPFVDAPAVPQGSVGYVYLINDLGIMTGDGKRFNPMGTLTRAEMAVLFNKLDDIVDNDNDKNEYTGIVQDIDDDEIVLKVRGITKTFDINEDEVVAYDGRDQIDYTDIPEGAKVLVQTEDDEVVYIEILDENVEDEIEGTITNIDLTGDYHISIDHVVFNLSEDADVEIDDEDAKLEDLDIGMEVEAILEDDMIISVSAKEIVTEIDGIIQEVDDESLKVLVDDKVKEYDFSDDLEVSVKDYPDELDSLKKGMKVELKLKNNYVTSIYAEDNSFEVEGKIEDIDYSNGKYTLTLEVDDEDYVYDVSDDVDIAIEDVDDPDMDDLEEGQEGNFEIINTTVVEIDIED